MKNRTSAFRLATAGVPFLILLLVIAGFMLSNPVYDRTISKTRKVANGEVSLADNRDGITQIQGEWLFWWKRFVADTKDVSGTKLAVLPGAWSNAGITDRFGYASYGLRVSGLDPAKRYAFRIGQTLSSCRILVNGEVVRSIGTPGTSKAAEQPYWNTINAQFSPAADGTADLVLQVSNFHDRNGGSNTSLYIGEASLMFRMEDCQKMTEGLVFAVLAIMGLFFFALFAFRRKDWYFFWFACICLVVGFRTLCYDGCVLLDLFPTMSWPVFFRVGYLTFPLVIIAFIAFLHAVFPALLKRGSLVAVSAIFGLYVLVILFAPEFITARLLTSFQLIAVAFVVYGVGVIVRACYLGLDGAVWLLVGFSFAVLTFSYDILVSLWILSGISFSHLGMCLCLFCIGLMEIARYSSSFREAQQMSDELEVINRSLRRFVPAEFLAFLKKRSLADVMPGDCVETEMAILSADIRSFTNLAERMQPNEVFIFLNEYLELVGPVIRANGGFIAKYEGDGFMALFPSGSDAAVRCAVQMQSAIANRNRYAAGKPAIAVGIGIDSGKLALGTVGDESRIDGTVVSSCVKCAGKYESATKQFNSRILINGTVFSELADPLSWFLRPVDRIDLLGEFAFLFEVYNNDQDLLRDLKWKTQGDLERGVYAYFSGNLDESRSYISRVLSVFPDDPVARSYAHRLQL
jgi:class 3 adenylate cyclase